MNEINLKRKESQAHQIVADILANGIKNANVVDPIVMDVVLSSDLSHLKVFVNLSGNQNKGIEALNNAAGYVRSILAKRLDWRKVPQIVFKIDDVSANGFKIDEILRKLNSEN
ncbi:30S ribosome-binding factor RbfA [Mycoplasmopsis gallinacea]|uniref:Ribosome-binding factor A n=1 Tax=Mycoplasmopsis gallinacea TaxID=29556 RepID=A0A6H0V3A2_9BACT|nr:30S ribosome-binding factor RbfA [Mycoplasmopsis gallinacea]QIW62169.1 30S ribosome-binding factor RbfA [Mycoplasmopsis gallinacea]